MDIISPNQLTRRDFIRGTTVAGMALLSSGCSLVGESDGNKINDRSNFETEPNWEQDFKSMQSISESLAEPELKSAVPGWGKKRLASAYTDREENLRIEKGLGLVIEAHDVRDQPYFYEDDPEHSYDITSARITFHSLATTYGKFVVTATLPEGPGAWAAAWWLSDNNPHQVDMARINGVEHISDVRNSYLATGGEIDLVETGLNGGTQNVFQSAVHTFSKSHESNFYLPDANTKFNDYGLEWDPEKIVMTVNDEIHHVIRKPGNHNHDWPFNHGNAMYPILNLAMGGSAGSVNFSKAPWRFVVKNMRHYSLV